MPSAGSSDRAASAAARRRYLCPPGALDAHSFEGLDFSGVSMRSFLLRANPFQLERFCDGYLNQDIPKEMARFRPVGPFVLFQVLNYGRMSPVTDSLGWVAQHEVLFAVPVQGYWHEEGRRVEGLASVSPFIFVDNDWSVLTGREIYGWPKYPASIVPEVNAWMQDPCKPRRLLSLETFLFPRLYAGRRLQRLVLLELTHAAPKVAQFPPDPGFLLNPLLELPRAMVDSAAMLPDLFRTFLADGPGGGYAAWTQSALEGLWSEPAFNTLNLKQFRSSHPGSAAYQSLVNARMKVKRFNGAGILGATEVLRGDPTGGFTLYIHRYPDFPIVESLGLEVTEETTGRGVPIAALRPLMPYWVSLDLRYDRGVRLCWRARGTQWALGSAAAGECAKPARFNNVLGPLIGSIEGPFDFHDTKIRILPLETVRRAHEAPGGAAFVGGGGSLEREIAARLEKPIRDAVGLLRELRGEKDRRPGEIEGLTVTAKRLGTFLIVKTLDRMSASANDVGWWGGRAIEFVSILELGLRRRVRGDEADWAPDIVLELLKGGKKEAGGGNAPPFRMRFFVVHYEFADSPLAVSAMREVLGRPAAYSTILRGRDPWLSSSTANRRLLAARVRDYPALGVGQGAEIRTLLEIHKTDGDDGGGRKGVAKAAAPDELKLTQKYRNGIQLPNLSFKQFRDEVDPRLFCYQSLVAQHQFLGPLAKNDKPLRIRGLPGNYLVKFERLPSWPIVDTLGLVVEDSELTPEGATREVCRVVRPLELEIGLRQNPPLALERQSVDGIVHCGGRSQLYLVERILHAEIDGYLRQDRKKRLGEVREVLERISPAVARRLIERFGRRRLSELVGRDVDEVPADKLLGVLLLDRYDKEILGLSDLILPFSRGGWGLAPETG